MARWSDHVENVRSTCRLTLKTFATRDFRLQSGVVMPEVTIAYRTLGTLSRRPRQCGAGHPWQHQRAADDRSRRIDRRRKLERDSSAPARRSIPTASSSICPNMLGSSYGSTNAASIDPATGKRYGPRFPDITVERHRRHPAALLDHLGIERLVAIVGPSYGGFQAFQWAVELSRHDEAGSPPSSPRRWCRASAPTAMSRACSRPCRRIRTGTAATITIAAACWRA